MPRNAQKKFSLTVWEQDAKSLSIGSTTSPSVSQMLRVEEIRQIMSQKGNCTSKAIVFNDYNRSMSTLFFKSDIFSSMLRITSKK